MTVATKKALSGQVAIVTGSTSGIGSGIAAALAEAGADVVLNGFGDAGHIEGMRLDLATRCGVRVGLSGADMTRPAEIAAMVREAEAAFGRLDILVNNAGIQHVAPIAEFPEAQWDRIIAINLSACFHTIKAALPAMQSRGSGRIVNIASVHGLVASPFKGAYVAAKHGLIGLTKTVALETATAGITCNAICPGFVRTPLVEAQIPDLARQHGMSEEHVVREVVLASQPNRRFVDVDEIGQLVVFLCSAGAASITGAALPIDGAWLAR
jgi:3-hydroxybutyrate dehydrogenase